MLATLSAVMWLLKQYLSGPVEAVSKARVGLPSETSKSKKGCLTSFSAIVNYVLKLFATEGNIAPVDEDI